MIFYQILSIIQCQTNFKINNGFDFYEVYVLGCYFCREYTSMAMHVMKDDCSQAEIKRKQQMVFGVQRKHKTTKFGYYPIIHEHNLNVGSRHQVLFVSVMACIDQHP